MQQRKGGKQVPVSASFRLRADKTPMHLDLTAKEKAWQGILRLEGDLMHLALGSKGRRPTGFKSTAESTHLYMCLRRVGTKAKGCLRSETQAAEDGSMVLP